MNARQQTILKTLIEEYINLAEPIGSKFLSKKYDWGISAATVRNDLAELDEEGYLEQPHTSAGRVPTDKGYRFFVRYLTKEFDRKFEDFFNDKQARMVASIFAAVESEHRIFKGAAKALAELSDNLGIAAVFDSMRDNSSGEAGEDEVFKFGMPGLLRQPDFDEIDEFWRLADDFETIDERLMERGAEICACRTTQVFIGRENPLVRHDDWSLVVSGYEKKNGKKGVAGILGPKRMKYGRNISLVGRIAELLNGR